ncbi:MAG: zinc ribbon domain-containing protein [Myxococcales bacterium]|nr:zinc ribbon domain-containing protein [Myxococcales bacterium]
MPIYEYECGSCGHRYEKMVRIGADAPPCPECASIEVRKLVSQSSFVLKGGGWYKDHYGLKKDGGSKSDTTKKSDGGAAAKTEAKPASTTPPAKA